MTLRKTAFAFGLIFTLLLSACGQQGGAAPAADLTGQWTLTTLYGQEPLSDTTITANFENGEIGGQAGCNSYGGQYSTAGQSLSISTLVQTEMACLNPAGVMDQESTYLKTLPQAASFSINGDQLEIQNAAGETILTFTKTQ